MTAISNKFHAMALHQFMQGDHLNARPVREPRTCTVLDGTNPDAMAFACIGAGAGSRDWLRAVERAGRCVGHEGIPLVRGEHQCGTCGILRVANSDMVVREECNLDALFASCAPGAFEPTGPG